MATYKSDAKDSHNAKLKKMTTHYGAANPSMVKYAPDTEAKENGPMEHVGFGAEEDSPRPRLDRGGRRSKNPVANPVPTYATGGGVPGLSSDKPKRAAKGTTNINIIVAPGKGGADAPAPVGLGSAVPPGGGPPPMPPGPPPGAGGPPPGSLPPPGGVPPGSIPPGLMPGRKRGGGIGMTAGAQSGEGRLEKDAARRRHAKSESPKAV